MTTRVALLERIPDHTIAATELGPLEWRPLHTLSHYHPRWTWPPSFRDTWEWRALEADLRAHGLRDPLIILADGRVIDGDHRYELAEALGLDPVPVRVARLPLPLSDADQLRVEAFAIQQAAARRRLTRHQIDALLLDLELAQGEVNRAAIRQSNLRRGETPGQPLRLGPTAEALARATGVSPIHLKRLQVVAHRGTRELHEQIRRGHVSVTAAYRTLKRKRLPNVPEWQTRVGALVADGHALIEHILDLASGCERWPAATRQAFTAALGDLAEALAARRRRLDPEA